MTEVDVEGTYYKEMTDADAINAFITDDPRTTVMKAAKKRIDELND